MRAIVMSLVAVSLVMLALPHVAAADCGDRIVLSSTADGDAVGASGVAYVGANDASMTQTFIVQVSAAIADGTQLLVFANGLQAGTVTVSGGMATLDLSAANGALPAGADPVCQIGPIWVTDAGQTTTLLLNPEIN
jgi:hypothetical protein